MAHCVVNAKTLRDNLVTTGEGVVMALGRTPMLSSRANDNAFQTIWLFAFGYFAAYVPYSALTKAVTAGLFDDATALSGFRILPISVMASVVGMYLFLGVMGWYKAASSTQIGPFRIPHPSKWTLLSGLCTATIVATTTMAYTFTGVSIVFIMLLMRGGVLMLAPIVDTLAGRKTQWFSWVGLAFSLAALVVAYSENAGTDITLVCAIDVALYIAGYFVRLQLMTRLAKSTTDADANRRFFVEEQLVATPAVLIFLAVVALVGGDFEMAVEFRHGFVDVWSHPTLPFILLIGLCSQFTGVFGGLVLLDKSENTFSVPVNRSSSIIAGVVVSYALWAFFGRDIPSAYKLAGAGLVIVAILFLSIPPLLERQRARVRP